MWEKVSAGRGEQSVKRWTELHRAMASAAACTGAERDNLPVSEKKKVKSQKLSFTDGVQHYAWWVPSSLLVRGWVWAWIAKTSVFSCFIIMEYDSRQTLVNNPGEEKDNYCSPLFWASSCIWGSAYFHVWICALVMRFEYAHGTVMSASFHAEGIPCWMIHSRPLVTWMLVILCIHSHSPLCSSSTPTPALVLYESHTVFLSLTSFSATLTVKNSPISCNHVCSVSIRIHWVLDFSGTCLVLNNVGQWDSLWVIITAGLPLRV